MKPRLLKAHLFTCFLAAMFMVVGCAGAHEARGKNTAVTDHDPRQSFVKIDTMVSYDYCDESGICIEDAYGSDAFVSSGFIVYSDKRGSYVVTTGHSCDPFLYDPEIKMMADDLGVVINTSLQLVQYDESYVHYTDIELLDINPVLDTCILFAENMTNKDYFPLAESKPEYGDRVMNYSNAANSYAGDAVLAMEGIYSGDAKSDPDSMLTFRDGIPYEAIAMFSLSATHGSSGSPILNLEGAVVGMVHSGNPKLPEIAYSPEFYLFQYFIVSTIDDHRS
jgi:hypothetical protein